MDAARVLLLGLQAFATLGPALPDWAIVLITLTVVAAIGSSLYGVKKACQFRKEMSVGCGCGPVTPYGCHHEVTGQRFSVK
uniref:Mucin like 3 n=1 Tax=Pipistrellus kuhlii TaxID=59472 RepID=A0A7J7QWN2_PIPKU|nr:mucin like 3 [Pipistrellus kuhlii]